MRYELSDCEWGVIKPVLPNKPRGIPRVDDGRVLNGIFWVLRSGAPWRCYFFFAAGWTLAYFCWNFATRPAVSRTRCLPNARPISMWNLAAR